jgi:hypothetical protein
LIYSLCFSPIPTEHWKGSNYNAGIFAMKNTFRSQLFVSQWLTYATDIRAITDLPSELGENAPEFVDHRHDQSVLSLLTKKWGIPYNNDVGYGGFSVRDHDKS